MLPILRRNQVYEMYLDYSGRFNSSVDFSYESTFLLYGMMALSARFSTLSCLTTVKFEERGTAFARKAQKMLEDRASAPGSLGQQQKTTLKWLQGCLLLAYHSQGDNPQWMGDPLVYECQRLAAELELHRIDEDSPSLGHLQQESPKQWAEMEERRRAWWAVWDMSTFNAVASGQVFSVDKDYRVFLPASDEAWFEEKPVSSAVLNLDVRFCWKSLKDCANQDEWASFIVSNYIMVRTCELGRQRNVDIATIEEIDTVVACWMFLFQEHVPADLSELVFDDQNYVKSNWTILSLLMIHT